MNMTLIVASGLILTFVTLIALVHRKENHEVGREDQVREAVRELISLGDSLRSTDTKTLPDEVKATLPTKVLSGAGHA